MLLSRSVDRFSLYSLFLLSFSDERGGRLVFFVEVTRHWIGHFNTRFHLFHSPIGKSLLFSTP